MAEGAEGSGSASPPPRALDWVCKTLGDAKVVDVSSLPGGMSSAVHHIRLRAAGGSESDVVLKRFCNKEWLVREPDLAEREAAALEAVAALDVPAPTVLACDPSGLHCGEPALVMSVVPGVPKLPRSPDADWLGKLASPLPALHAAGEAAAVGLPPYRPYAIADELDPPRWARDPAVWVRGFRILQDPPSAARSLIHRDYHPCNVLWSGGEITGIIDWTVSCSGPIAIDIAHCRLNLVCLYDIEVADEFLWAYRERTGFRHDPFWDLRCAVDMLPLDGVYPGWVDLGRDDLELDGIRARADRWVSMLVAELGGD